MTKKNKKPHKLGTTDAMAPVKNVVLGMRDSRRESTPRNGMTIVIAISPGLKAHFERKKPVSRGLSSVSNIH
jgi:hypothetical protein